MKVFFNRLVLISLGGFISFNLDAVASVDGGSGDLADMVPPPAPAIARQKSCVQPHSESFNTMHSQSGSDDLDGDAPPPPVPVLARQKSTVHNPHMHSPHVHTGYSHRGDGCCEDKDSERPIHAPGGLERATSYTQERPAPNDPGVAVMVREMTRHQIGHRRLRSDDFTPTARGELFPKPTPETTDSFILPENFFVEISRKVQQALRLKTPGEKQSVKKGVEYLIQKRLKVLSGNQLETVPSAQDFTQDASTADSFFTTPGKQLYEKVTKDLIQEIAECCDLMDNTTDTEEPTVCKPCLEPLKYTKSEVSDFLTKLLGLPKEPQPSLSTTSKRW